MESIVLVLDDDLKFTKELQQLLDELGLQGEFFSEVDAFIDRLNIEMPVACIVDLDIIGPGVGLTLIKAIRKTRGSELPLFVSANVVGRQILAHAIEKGADNFFLKPLDKEIVASKLSRYVRTEKISEMELNLRHVPGSGSPATLSFGAEVEEVDETGARLRSNHLISKGTLLELGGFLFDEIGNQKKFKVIKNWVNQDRKTYGAFVEFDPWDDDLRRAVRRWLVEMEGP